MRTRSLPPASPRVSTTGSRPSWVRRWAAKSGFMRPRRSCSRWGRLQRGKILEHSARAISAHFREGRASFNNLQPFVLVLVLGLNLLLLLEYWLNLLGARRWREHFGEIRVVLLLRRQPLPNLRHLEQ